MKALAWWLGTLLAPAIVVPAVAQAPTGSRASPTQAPSAPSSPGADVRTDAGTNQPAKGSEAQPSANVNADRKDQSASDRDDDGAALPRTATGHSAIFGLSPTASVIVGAALLVVVILAIVATTRPGETTYVDRDRRF